MSTKLPWTRLNADQWIIDVSCMKPMEKAVYLTLSLFMRKTQEPLDEDTSLLSRYVGCSEKVFNKALIGLLCIKKIVRLEDGRLWSLEVEEELNNSNENLNKFSERAHKAAKARWDKNIKDDVNDAKNAISMLDDAKNSISMLDDANSMLDDAINNNNNINIYNKKTNTIVLAKKEIDFEDSEITDLVDEPIEVDAIESQSDQITTSLDNQPSFHEQKSVSKKAKRIRTDRGCRLPADFEPDYDFAVAEGLPPERVKVEIAKFRDYWKAKSGANATKTDWQATWRNWVRNSKDHKINKQGGNYGSYTQRQKSIGERIADSVLDIGNRGYFEAHSRDDSTGLSVGFERWQQTNETTGSNCFRGW